MALDLTIAIKADATQAKAELAKVESGLQNIEKAAKKGEPSLAEVAKQLGVNTGAADKMVRSTVQLEQTTKTLADSTANQTYQQLRASLGMADMEKRAAALTTQTTALNTATMGYATSVGLIGSAIAAFLTVGALELKFLYDSARLYAERTGLIDQFKDEISKVTRAWQEMQFAVGAALLGDVHNVKGWGDSIVSIVNWVGSQIAIKVTEIRAGIALITGGLPPLDDKSWLKSKFPGLGFLGGAIDQQLPAYGAPGWTPGATYNEPTARPPRPPSAPYVLPSIPYHIGYTGQVPGFEASVGMPYQLPTIPMRWGLEGFSVPGFQVSGMFGGIPGAPAARAPGFLGSVFGGQFGGNLANVIMSAVTGGGSFLQGAGSLVGSSIGSFAQKSLGAMSGIGGFLGSMLPGVGALLGPALGGIQKLFGKLFGETQGHKDLMAANAKIAGIKSDLLRDYGSAENIKLLGGGDLNAGWGGQNVEGLRAFSGEVEKFRAQANNAMNDMIRSALVAGQQIPAGMQPILETLIRQGQLTEANANLLMGLPEKGVPSFQAITEAAKELGVNVETLGAKVQNIKLTEQAEAAAAAFQTLADAGADMGQVFEQSAPKIQEMVDRAIRMGLELPESIKPWIEKMSEAGDIMVDLSQLKFAKPLEKSVEDLIAKLDELIQKLGGGVTDAINRIPRNVDVEVNTRYVDPGPDADPAGNYAQGGVVYAARGWGSPRGTDTVRAWLTPGEIVLNAAQQKRVANAITGGPTVNITFSQPVLANDHTSLSIFAEFIEKATLNALASRGSRWVG